MSLCDKVRIVFGGSKSKHDGFCVCVAVLPCNLGFILAFRFTRKLLVAVVDKWDGQVLVIDKVAPSNWKV